MGILESLKKGFVLGDGGYLEEAKFRGYSTPKVIVEFPEVLRQIHVDFFRAGSQVLQAHTWWTTRKYLKQRGEEPGLGGPDGGDQPDGGPVGEGGGGWGGAGGRVSVRSGIWKRHAGFSFQLPGLNPPALAGLL